MPIQQLIRFSWSKANVTKGQKASFMAISPDRIEIDHPGPYTCHIVANSTDYRLFTLGLKDKLCHFVANPRVHHISGPCWLYGSCITRHMMPMFSLFTKWVPPKRIQKMIQKNKNPQNKIIKVLHIQEFPKQKYIRIVECRIWP